MSQYEAHLRAILDMEIPPDSLALEKPAIMLNILGGQRPDSHILSAKEAVRVPRARVHLYGKGDARPGRKMGHITLTAENMQTAEQRMEPLIRAVDRLRRAAKDDPTLPKPNTVVNTPKPPETPVVAVTMGSDSDLPTLKPGIAILEELGIPFTVTITSAHRTPTRMLKFAEEAVANGLKVIIAAAGGAAHLPGMVASSTTIPVIGVPVKGSVLDGHDSLLSIVQMPVR